jgi:hypothetical protein
MAQLERAGLSAMASCLKLRLKKNYASAFAPYPLKRRLSQAAASTPSQSPNLPGLE